MLFARRRPRDSLLGFEGLAAQGRMLLNALSVPFLMFLCCCWWAGRLCASTSSPAGLCRAAGSCDLRRVQVRLLRENSERPHLIAPDTGASLRASGGYTCEAAILMKQGRKYFYCQGCRLLQLEARPCMLTARKQSGPDDINASCSRLWGLIPRVVPL
jgi:hypothetical protein